jgi:hypothetical protein
LAIVAAPLELLGPGATLIPIGAGAIAVWTLVRLVSKRNSERAWLEAAHPEWEEQMLRWSRLIYCSRCGTLADPVRKRSAPSTDLQALL